MSDAPPALRMRGVSKSFGAPGRAVPVLRGLDLDLRPGRLCAVLGPSGSGKTTLLHLAALLDTPDEGTIELDGRPAGRLDRARAAELRRSAVGMVFQRFHLLPHRTALQNVLFRFRYLDTPPDDARRRAEAALRDVGLAHLADRPARLLSGGEMQRVAIARALAAPPRVLLADEPTGNLDEAAATHIFELVRACRDRGIAVLVATHHPGWAGQADEVHRLDHGRLVRERCAP
jgi:putative ABC transport system ATP-binding protein